MKRLLKLTFNEIKHLKWTVIVTALALTLFTASLFSVVCVYLDLTDNILSYFDTLDEPLSISAQNVSIRDVGLANGHGIFHGKIDFVTDWRAVLSANGNEFALKQELQDDKGNIHQTTHAAYAFYVTDEFAEAEFDKLGIAGDADTVNAICLHRMVADKLQVEAGGYVDIGDNRYRVVGIYDEDDPDSWTVYSVIHAFTLFVDENAVFSELDIQTETSRQTYDLLLSLQRKKIDADYSYGFKTYVENLSLVNAFLIAIAITVFLVVMLLFYVTISVILNNRRPYVCRLKTIGATDGIITAMYYIIIFILLSIICVAAFFLSKLMVVNIMRACEQAFETTFVTNVNFGVTAVYFAAVAALLAVFCYLCVRKVDDKTIVTVTRNDL